MQKFLFVGLGNPGLKYNFHRHNIGNQIISAYAKANEIHLKERRFGYIGKAINIDTTIYCLLPTTFMNLSGTSVAYWIKKHHIPLCNILIVSDDVSLDFGYARVRSGGSSGGHNGLKDIELNIRTQNYARLRVGVGPLLKNMILTHFVLSDLHSRELLELEKGIDNIFMILDCFIKKGIAVCMNSYNGKSWIPS